MLFLLRRAGDPAVHLFEKRLGGGELLALALGGVPALISLVVQELGQRIAEHLAMDAVLALPLLGCRLVLDSLRRLALDAVLQAHDRALHFGAAHLETGGFLAAPINP